MDQEKLHVAIVSSPGMGHLVPALLLANRIATHHHRDVTILAVTTETSPVETQLLNSLTESNNINIIKIPLPSTSNEILHPNDTVVTYLAVMMREARKGIRSAISDMSHRPHVLIADLFSTDSLPLADEFGLQKYVFLAGFAHVLALMTYLHVLDKEVMGQYVDRIEPLIVPGCVPVLGENVPDPMLDRDNRMYDEYVRMGTNFTTLSNGILVNTWRDLDPRSLDALNYDQTLRSVVKVPVYGIGPLTREVKSTGLEGNEVIEWLNKQPIESVLFVSFGSAGALSSEQITELAWGLELSQQRFVWVTRPPARSSASNEDYLNAGSDGPKGPSDFLPEGFLTRNQKLGLLVPSWAPQIEILNHPSIGGFLTHCGMNSVCESIKAGVPMITWPLHAEQRMNAAMLKEQLKVAVGPAVLPAKKVVGREEIEKMVRSLIKDKEMRGKVKALGKTAKETMEINGSSYNSMCEFINRCETKMESVQGNL